jgi:protoporphyrinogen oxidase
MIADYLILGAGVTGLSAGVELKDAAVVVEKDKTPGGLVRSFCFDGGYWYDYVLHLLHFKDPEIQARVEAMIGPIMRSCPPKAWIQTLKGTAMYPFQLNLGSLEEEARNQCIVDYAKAYYHKNAESTEKNYREYLKATFGDAMCDLFYYPYNEKLYKYALEKIAVDDLTWNLHRPSFEDILKGGFQPNVPRATYNTNAFYPCPPEKDAPLRGMELLSQALANHVKHLKLNRKVTAVNPANKSITTVTNGMTEQYRYNEGCLSTIPLPVLMKLCNNASDSLLKEVDTLEHTKVISIGISIKGSRPASPGHWRYYTDPAIPFTRLVFMNEFDPQASPEDGWALLTEVTWPGKEPIPEKDTLINQVVNAIKSLSLLPNDNVVIGTHVWVVDPAYVIFTHDTQRIINNCFEFLARYRITSSGRYGKWEYSSMFQNIKAGFDWAKKVNKKTLA